MARQPIGTVIVGHSALLREGLARILAAENFRILGSASSVDDLVLSSSKQHQCILLIIDICDEPENAVEQLVAFKKRQPSARIAVLANHYQPNDLFAVFRAGANAYFVDVESCDAFIKSLELIVLGEIIVPPAFLSFLVSHGKDREYKAIAQSIETETEILFEDEINYPPRLSVKEKIALVGLIAGYSNKAIARKMDITEGTVKMHVKAILRKIRVNNRTQAAIWASNHNSLIFKHDPPNEIDENVRGRSDLRGGIE